MALNSLSNNEGRGDALWRTALAYLVGFERCLGGIDACIIPGKQYCRYPGDCDTTSRDQIAMAFCAIKLRNPEDILYFTHNLPWRISKKHSQTIDFWLWVKAIRGSYYALVAWHAVTFLILCFVVYWNFVIRLVTFVRKYDQHNFPPKEKRDKAPKWKKKLWKLLFPTYALFILSLQLKAAGPSQMTPFIEFLMRLEAEKDNYFIQVICGGKAGNYDGMKGGIRWNNRLDDTNNINMWVGFEAIPLDIHLLNWVQNVG